MAQRSIEESYSKEHANVEEKRRQWDKIVAQVDSFRDKLGEGVDQGIRETVAAFISAGVHATGSCEGHFERGELAPYIDVETPDIDELEEREQGLPDGSEEHQRLIREIRRKNLKERAKVLEILKRFYHDRRVSVDRRLIVNPGARGWSRIESQGVSLQEARSDVERARELSGYQEEMHKLTRFLRDEFFSGEVARKHREE
jgi:hypothetical protein